MNLKVKLLSAFCIIIFLPIVLVSASVGVIVYYQANSIQKDYGLNTNSIQEISNSMQLLNRGTRGVYNEIKLAALKDSSQLEDLSYIEELNGRLETKYSFLIVRKDGDFIFNGNEKLADMVESSLPKFGVYSTDVDGGIYIGGDNSFLVKQQDFYYEDGSEGSIFVVTDVNIIVPQIRKSVEQMMVSFVLIMMLTALILCLWIYRGIVRPLNKLRRATYEIKEGNLDYSIKESGEDEIGQLCSDFEEMRIRLKQLIEAKLENEKQSKELFSNISHDLKTPLTAIKGYAEGIMDGVADTPEKKETYLKTIYKKASDMTVLVDELHYYTKIDADTMSYNFKAINLADYFGDCIEEYSVDAESKNIHIAYENHVPETVKVVADAEQLKRVINNIVGNSVKYMGKSEGSLLILLTDALEEVEIEITDDGEGIAAKDLPHIFDRFYRADASRNSKKGGSGLGLAIVKKIINDHGGRIWARSTEGVGTTIGFTLKKVKEEESYE